MTNSIYNKTENIDKAYSSEPWWYDARGFLILTFAYRSTLPAQIKHFGFNIKNPHLEVAIGSGTLFNVILKWRRFKKLPSVKTTGFDYAERMLYGAKQRFKKDPDITLLRADAAQLPFPDNTFESANAANCIHCFPEIEGSLRDIYRVLKPGGTFAGNVLLYPKGNSILDWIANRINQWGIKKGILHRPYHREEIKSYLSIAGFKIIHEQVTGNCYEFIAAK